jgi:hypothetical protein
VTHIDWLIPKTWHRLGPTLLVLLAVVGTGFVLCGTSLYAGRHCERFLRLSSPPDGSEALAAIPMEYALSSNEYNDVIFLGDSAPLYSIDPKCFEELTGLKAYNLASFRPIGINGYLMTVQAYLSRHPAPHLVVLCVSPEVPGGTDAERDIARRFVRVYGNQIANKNPAVSAIVQSTLDDDTGDVLIKRGVSILQDDVEHVLYWRHRSVLDELIVGSDKETYRTFSKRLGENRGYIKPTELHGEPNGPQYAGVRFSVRPEWDRAVRALIALTDATGVRLAIRFAPARSDASAENFDGVVSGLRSLQNEFPQISVDPTIRYYDAALCYDLWHLNVPGAQKYTRHLAKDLSLVLAKSASKPVQHAAVLRSP